RLAIQLSRQGYHQQAAEHYRRAYELMPVSFGRVESHCFGCESVFEGSEPQSIAEQVFQKLVAKEPGNARVHYLQGYLFEEEHRYAEALPAFRTAVQIDGDYLNAWRHLNQLSAHMHLNAVDRDVVIMRLLQLDPQQRHVSYEVGEAGDFAMLWNTAAEVSRGWPVTENKQGLYPLRESARHYEQQQAKLPAEMRSQLEQYQELILAVRGQRTVPSPALVLGKHQLLRLIGSMISPTSGGEFEE
ncbi:MAG: tetratricopeptide repeat protein, partial [Gammaproteobacteria bacterium]|nr:tetratricopeptide repeat protein [Gammaproteobacteria bacterium]MBV9696740.1 tetratricopeptide repeat protein [Gammaproteobacteria bacterium]